nr:family 43 glycosylhydrolase [Paenibacillus bovis]
MKILCYTREPKDDAVYSEKLAYSMHLAWSEDGGNFQALNHNSGILFAKATENEDGTMNPKSLKCPYMFPMNNGLFGVVAIRTQANGENDDESIGKVLFFQTSDFLQYEEIGLVDICENEYIMDVTCHYDELNDVFIINWCNEKGNWYRSEIVKIKSGGKASKPSPIHQVELEEVNTNIEGIVPRNMIPVSTEIGNRLKYRLSPPINTTINVPNSINASSPDELKNIKATAIYNDGTTSDKKIDWQLEEVDWDNPGIYEINGTVYQDEYTFPVAINRADPNVGKWDGKYYFIATNDENGNKTLSIKEANSIPELVNAKEELILDTVTYEHIGNLLWAPELHVINDDLYIFFAATPEQFLHEEAHVMKLKKGGNPICKDDWTEPKRVVKRDGSFLCEAGKTISLDMTVFKYNGDYYASWSERQFVPVDIGAWIYLAKIDPLEPWKLITDPILLTKPDYGWANNHTFVDEGSFVIQTDKKIFMTFSSALVDATYCVGLLTANNGADLLDPKSWTKSNYPLLTSRSVSGEYGPGHNSYVMDDDGVLWNVYHARNGIDGPRCTGIRRVHFDIDGYPVLDLTEERDINPELKHVSTKLIVQK